MQCSLGERSYGQNQNGPTKTQLRLRQLRGRELYRRHPRGASRYRPPGMKSYLGPRRRSQSQSRSRLLRESQSRSRPRRKSLSKSLWTSCSWASWIVSLAPVGAGEADTEGKATKEIATARMMRFMGASLHLG